MPRVHHVKAARKANPVAEVGESYYWWQFRNGGKRYSKTPPRASQLTSSEKLSRAYEAAEQIEDIEVPEPETHAELQAAASDINAMLNVIADDVEELATEYRDSAENIRESFSESPTADECEEKADTLDAWADEIRSAADTIESLDEDEDIDSLAEAIQHELDGVAYCPL